MANDTISEKEIQFNDVKKFVENADFYRIKFGALRGGATQSFFKVLLFYVLATIFNNIKFFPII